MRKLNLCILGAAVLVVSCRREQARIPTPSGQPEITVSTATLDCVRDRIFDYAIDSGYRPRSLSPNQVVATKPASEGLGVAISSFLGDQVDRRMTFTITSPREGAARIVVHYDEVVNAGTSLERVTIQEPTIPEYRIVIQQLTALFATRPCAAPTRALPSPTVPAPFISPRAGRPRT